MNWGVSVTSYHRGLGESRRFVVERPGGEYLAETAKFRDNNSLPPAAGVQPEPAGAGLGCGVSCNRRHARLA
jgi:hypothetical protein